MNKSQEIMSRTLNALAKQQAKVDGIAGGILEAIKAGRIEALEKFDQLVYAAYDENGWNYKAGRPVAGVAIERVPQIIRVYVSTIRAAYLLDLPMTTFDSMYQVREAIAGKRGQTSGSSAGATAETESASMVGIRLLKPDELTGAPVHDLAVVMAHLPDDQRELLEKSIDRLVKKYAPIIEEKLQAA